MVGTAYFLSHLTDGFKRDYSRAVYDLLAKHDLSFRYGAKALHLEEATCDPNDRFAFLYICKKTLEKRDRNLALAMYSLRVTGFNFILSDKYGVSIRPMDKWNTAGAGEPSNSVQNFLYAWRIGIPQTKRKWIKAELENMEYGFPEFNGII